MPLPLEFNLLCDNYRGEEGESPRSAHFAEFTAEGPPKCKLVIHRTSTKEFMLAGWYKATFNELGDNLKLPIEFPNFVFKCSHVQWSEKHGEHAHIVAETGGFNARAATANFWNLAKGTFEVGKFYGLTIEFGEREVDPELLRAIIDQTRRPLPQSAVPIPAAQPVDRFFQTNVVARM